MISHSKNIKILLLSSLFILFNSCSFLQTFFGWNNYNYYNPGSYYSGSQGGNYSGSSSSSPAQAPICKKCNGAGHYYINGKRNTCSQCGGLGRDWNS